MELIKVRSALTKRKTRINRTAFTIRASRKIRRALKLETGLSGLSVPVLEASHRNIRSSAISQIELSTMKVSSNDQSQSSPQKNSRQPYAHRRMESSNVNMKAKPYLMQVIPTRTEGISSHRSSSSSSRSSGSSSSSISSSSGSSQKAKAHSLLLAKALNNIEFNRRGIRLFYGMLHFNANEYAIQQNQNRKEAVEAHSLHNDRTFKTQHALISGVDTTQCSPRRFSRCNWFLHPRMNPPAIEEKQSDVEPAKR